MNNKDYAKLETLYEMVNPRLDDNEYFSSVNVEINCQNRDLAFPEKQPKAHLKYELVINYATWGIHYIHARVLKVGKIHAIYDDLTDDTDSNKSVEFDLDLDLIKVEFKVDSDGQIMPNNLEINLDYLDGEFKPTSAILHF